MGQDSDSLFKVEPPPTPVFENLPAWQEPFTTAEFRPTFILGVGGAAAQVLQQLQHRRQERFENLEDIPIFHSLLLDTDPRTLDKLSAAPEPACRLIDSELLSLRKPEDYREDAEQLMRWLGRRWIYNIPRSLRTEGLRPLGRLAFVDHARRVTEQIRGSLKKITSAAAIEESARQANMPVSEAAPLIYLIASISGGTGSGMILDLAFAVRQVLAEEGLRAAKICGILMHGTTRHAAEKKLAVANSYAFLRELQAYRRKYPGEPAGEFPPQAKAQGRSTILISCIWETISAIRNSRKPRKKSPNMFIWMPRPLAAGSSSNAAALRQTPSPHPRRAELCEPWD